MSDTIPFQVPSAKKKRIKIQKAYIIIHNFYFLVLLISIAMVLNIFVFLLLVAVAHSFSSNFSDLGVPGCSVTASPLVGQTVQERIMAQINLIKMEVNEGKSSLPTVKDNSISQFLSKSTKAYGIANR